MNNFLELDNLLKEIKDELTVRMDFITELGLNEKYEAYLKSRGLFPEEVPERIPEKKRTISIEEKVDRSLQKNTDEKTEKKKEEAVLANDKVGKGYGGRSL